MKVPRWIVGTAPGFMIWLLGLASCPGQSEQHVVDILTVTGLWATFTFISGLIAVFHIWPPPEPPEPCGHTCLECAVDGKVAPKRAKKYH